MWTLHEFEPPQKAHKRSHLWLYVHSKNFHACANPTNQGRLSCLVERSYKEDFFNFKVNHLQPCYFPLSFFEGTMSCKHCSKSLFGMFDLVLKWIYLWISGVCNTVNEQPVIIVMVSSNYLILFVDTYSTECSLILSPKMIYAFTTWMPREWFP